MSVGTAAVERVYAEFDDGTNRGLPDGPGRPDEPFDATTAMVLTWHAVPTDDQSADATVRYRRLTPTSGDWTTETGDWRPFWHREERIYRAELRGLRPDAIYELEVSTAAPRVHLHTMPASLTDRSVTIATAADLQQGGFDGVAGRLTDRLAATHPDLFVGGGDYVSENGQPTAGAAARWAAYLDGLYGLPDGRFLLEKTVDGARYPRVIVPHVTVIGNHEIGRENHLRWPSCVATSSAEPGYPTYIPAQWLELLFHWPFRSEGWQSELSADHPNADPATHAGFGHGGFGKLSFGDYLLLVVLDNNQNWETVPDPELRDWEGNRIVDRWPWFGTHHGAVRQDHWLRTLLEPEDGRSAAERYTHVLPFWHRGLFCTGRPNATIKNREILSAWLPPLVRAGVRLVNEAHEHNYARTVPIGIDEGQPDDARIERVSFEPNTWPVPLVPDEYHREYYTVECLLEDDDIVGWCHDEVTATHDPSGLIAAGHGGWGAGRRPIGGRGAGQAGWWFVDESNGGLAIDGETSYHVRTITLDPATITVAEYLADGSGRVPADPTFRYRTDPAGGPWERETAQGWSGY